MKKTALTAAAFASAAMMLAACGSTPAESAAESTVESTAESTVESTAEATPDTGNTEADVTPDSIRAANTMDALVSAYGKVEIRQEYTDATSTLYTNDTVFEDNGNGLAMYQDAAVEDNHTYTTYKATDANNFAGYINVNDSETTLVVLDPENREGILDMFGVPAAYGEETVTETGEQDGILMVVTENTLEGEVEGSTVYCVEPDTLRLVTMVQSYTTDGEVTGTLTYTFTYGDEVTAAIPDAADSVLTDDNACAVTVMIHPGEARAVEQTFNVKRDTAITAISEDGGIYRDAEFSEADYGITADTDALTLYIK